MAAIDCLQFDAASEYLDWGSLSATGLVQLESDTAWTLLAFVYSDDVLNRYPLYTKGYRIEQELRGDQSGDHIRVRSNATDILTPSSSDGITAATWCAMALVCDGTNATTSLTEYLQDPITGLAPGGGDGTAVSTSLIYTGAGEDAAVIRFGNNILSARQLIGRAALFCAVAEAISLSEFGDYRDDPLNTVEAWKSTKTLVFWHPSATTGTLTDDSGAGNDATVTGATVLGAGGPDVPALAGDEETTATAIVYRTNTLLRM